LRHLSRERGRQLAVSYSGVLSPVTSISIPPPGVQSKTEIVLEPLTIPPEPARAHICCSLTARGPNQLVASISYATSGSTNSPAPRRPEHSMRLVANVQDIDLCSNPVWGGRRHWLFHGVGRERASVVQSPCRQARVEPARGDRRPMRLWIIASTMLGTGCLYKRATLRMPTFNEPFFTIAGSTLRAGGRSFQRTLLFGPVGSRSCRLDRGSEGDGDGGGGRAGGSG